MQVRTLAQRAGTGSKISLHETFNSGVFWGLQRPYYNPPLSFFMVIKLDLLPSKKRGVILLIIFPVLLLTVLLQANTLWAPLLLFILQLVD